MKPDTIRLYGLDGDDKIRARVRVIVLRRLAPSGVLWSSLLMDKVYSGPGLICGICGEIINYLDDRDQHVMDHMDRYWKNLSNAERIEILTEACFG